MSQLVGTNTTGANQNVSGSYSVMGKFTATASGTANAFKVNLSGTGSIQVAVYADSAGAPGALLAATYSFSGAVGLNTVTITDTTITSGNVYWLAVDTTNVQLNITTTGGIAKFKPLTIGTAFPDPGGTGYTDDIWLICAYLDGTLASTSSPRLSLLGVG